MQPRMRNSRTKIGTGIPNAHNNTQPTFPLWLRNTFIDLSTLPQLGSKPYCRSGFIFFIDTFLLGVGNVMAAGALEDLFGALCFIAIL